MLRGSSSDEGTQRGRSSDESTQRGSGSEQAAVPAGDAHLGEAAPLLPGRAGWAAPGLRQRHGHEGAVL